ncbi:hypothetical protein [Actinoplanes sp. G11-F43]|uniref:hypothetical protein n=1 Tax=Actinoplanes sp. G11-F43 TaxID=3424130 RepID=UPI003D33071C
MGSLGRLDDAFLLLKPDCLRRGLGAEVDRTVAAAGLTVAGRRDLTLSPADVRALWAEYDDSGHGLTLGFLDRYLTTGPSGLLLVSGPDAFEAARRVKREVRSRFAEGPFANVIHAAELPAELARQRDHLTGVDQAAAKPASRPRGMDFRAHVDVPALVDEVWPLIQGEPADPGPYQLDPGVKGVVVLGPDRRHTLDSTVTALWHALPGVEPRRAVLLAMHAGFSGGSPIAVGGRAALRRCLRALREHGLANVSLVPV